MFKNLPENKQIELANLISKNNEIYRDNEIKEIRINECIKYISSTKGKIEKVKGNLK